MCCGQTGLCRDGKVAIAGPLPIAYAADIISCPFAAMEN